MKIGFDFDGTLAAWPAGVRPRYDDADWALPRLAAALATVKWLNRILDLGHEVVIVTGRGAEHETSLRYWLREFAGQWLSVVGRPASIGLSCEAQAAWKAEVLRNLGVSVYVGDNQRIEAVAARIAGCAFIDAAGSLRGELPSLAREAVA